MRETEFNIFLSFPLTFMTGALLSFAIQENASPAIKSISYLNSYFVHTQHFLKQFKNENDLHFMQTIYS